MGTFNCFNSHHSFPESHAVYSLSYNKENDNDKRFIANIEQMKISDLSSMAKLAHYVMVHKEELFHSQGAVEILEEKIVTLGSQLKEIKGQTTWIGRLFSSLFGSTSTMLSEKQREQDSIKMFSSFIDEIKLVKKKHAINTRSERI